MAVPFVLSDPPIDANFASVVATAASQAAQIATLNSEVAALTPTIAGSAATTDATVTTIATVPIATNKAVLITVNVSARRTGGVSGTAGDSAAYSLGVLAKNIGGTVTVVGTLYSFKSADQAAWTVTAPVSTTNVLIRIAGAAGNNIDWIATGTTLVAA